MPQWETFFRQFPHERDWEVSRNFIVTHYFSANWINGGFRYRSTHSIRIKQNLCYAHYVFEIAE
jgi:hypothetical protein